MITNILLTIVIICMVVAGLMAWYLLRYLHGVVRDFVSPEGDGQPSPLAKAMDAGASMLGRAIIAQAKTTLMGQASGQVRAGQAIDANITDDLLSTNPLASTLLGQFPSLRKTLRRNPQLADMAIAALARRFGGNNGGRGFDGSGAVSSPKFQL